VKRQSIDRCFARICPRQRFGSGDPVPVGIELRVDIVIRNALRTSRSITAQCRRPAGLGKALNPWWSVRSVAANHDCGKPNSDDVRPAWHAFLYRFWYGAGMVLADAEATKAFGARLAAIAQGGDAIALVGELGAGKTTLVSGLTEALGAGVAHSPTFGLVHEYSGGRLIVWHVDLYRIEREVELIELGIEDLVGDRRGIVVVEWADRFVVLPADHLRLELRHTTTGRELIAVGTGPRGRALAVALVPTA